MSRTILYVGNILSKHGNTPTFIETLAPKLKISFSVITCSNKKNKLIRLLDMVYVYLSNLNKIEIVLVDTYSTLNFFYAIIFAFLTRATGKKFVSILRGGNLPQLLDTSPRRCRYVFGRADALVAPSNFLVHEFEKYGYKVNYIPNFINLEQYKFVSRRKIAGKLVWVRAFQNIYNPCLAIEVVRKLVEMGVFIELTMIGPDKGMKGEVSNLVKKYELESVVRLYGKLEKSEWLTIANTCDIFLNTTNFDNRPVTLIEAMALGLPIISTNVGGIPDLIKDNVDGLLVPMNDCDAIVNQIEKLMGDPDLTEKLSKNGRIKAETFGWEQVGGSWNKLIEDALQ